MATAAYACMACACTDSYNRHADKMMARAESLMDEHPDSAMTLLDSIDSKLLRGERRRALHGLLSTQARDKNYIDQTSDSIMAPVTEYFDRTDDKYHRMLAHYYLAKIRYYSNECIDATKEAEYALELLDDNIENKLYWQGRIYDDLGEIAHKTSNHRQSIEYFSKAKTSFDSIKLYDWSADICNALVVEYQIVNEWDKSAALIEKTDTTQLSPIQIVVYKRNLVEELCHHGQYEEARKLFNNLLVSSPEPIKWECFDYGKLSYINAQIGDETAFRDCIRTAMSLATTKADTRKVAYFNFLGHLALTRQDSLSSLFKQYQYYSNSETVDRIHKHMSLGSVKHLEYQLENETLKNRIFKERILYLSIIVVLFLFIVAFCFMHFRNRKIVEIKALNVLNLTLRNDIEHLNAHNSQLIETKNSAIETIKSTLSTGIDPINQVSKKSYKASQALNAIDGAASHDNKNRTLKFERTFISELSQIISGLNTPALYKTLETIINYTDNDLMTRFKTDFPSISDNDYKLSVLLFSGIGSHAICMILEIPTLEVLRNRKSRLKKNFERSYSLYKEEYVKKISIK